MKPVSAFESQSKNTVLIVLSAVVLALGIALIANYVSSLLSANSQSLYLGAFLAAVALLAIFKLMNPKVVRLIKVRGAYFFDSDTLDYKKIIGYDFNSRVGKYLSSIGNENKAYAAALKKKNKKFDRNKTKYDPNILDFQNLSAAAVELVFLKQLGYHLNSYFVEEEVDRNSIDFHPKNKLSPEVLKNRVLDLTTRSREEREAFFKDGQVSYQSNNGALYEHISLELPKGSTITRNDDGTLSIESDIFKLNFAIDSLGFSTVVEPELIVGEYDAPYLVTAKIEVTIKKSLFLTQGQLKQHQWLDSFLERFEEYMSLKKLEESSYLQLVRVLKS